MGQGMGSEMGGRGVFVGLITLDCLHQVAAIPASNQKMIAQRTLLAAGGPATNAAATYAHLGGTVTVVGALGCHPLTSLIRDDLSAHRVQVQDLLPTVDQPPPLSTVLVTQSTGERAVVSRNSLDWPALPPLPPVVNWDEVDVLLVDGHQMALSETLARQARQVGKSVVVDGGSWKPGFERVLPLATAIVASANFCWPDTPPGWATVAALRRHTDAAIAITAGAEPIRYWQGNDVGTVAVPPVAVVDTLGAGDIFHGAFCHASLTLDFVPALAAAAQVAARSCQHFGTRAWMDPNVQG